MIIKFLKMEFLFFKDFQVTNGTHMYFGKFYFPVILNKNYERSSQKTLFTI